MHIVKSGCSHAVMLYDRDNLRKELLVQSRQTKGNRTYKTKTGHVTYLTASAIPKCVILFKIRATVKIKVTNLNLNLQKNMARYRLMLFDCQLQKLIVVYRRSSEL